MIALKWRSEGCSCADLFRVLLDLSRVHSEPSKSKSTCAHGLCYNSLISYM
jgi:hypothetical protein